MKKIFTLCLFSLLLFFPLKSSFAQTEITGEHIKNFDVSYVINKDATVDVIEKITYDFGLLQRHGIYRSIPTIRKNTEGKKYRLDYSNIWVTDETGQPYQDTRSIEGDYLKLKIGSASIYVTGVKQYIIKYKVSGAITYFSDHDELYWNATGNEWIVPIAASIVKISLPDEIKKENIKAVCYTGNQGSTASECSFLQDNNKVAISAKNVLYSNQGLSFAVSFPIDIVAHLEAKEVVDFWTTAFGRFLSKIILLLVGLWALFWYVLYPVKIIYKWWKYGKDPKGTVGETRAWFDPPKLKNGRAMTPAEVGSLIDETVHLRDISAGIVDLARRGYFKIEERKKNDFWFIKGKTYKGDDSLQPFERKLLESLFEVEDEVRIKGQQLAPAVQEASEMVYEQMVTDDLFPKNPNSTRIFYSVIAVLALVSGNLGLALVAFTFGRAMPAKSIFGVNCTNIAKSLKNFLSSQERQLAFQAKNQLMFERLLPFAVAFGVEKIWVERFKDMNLQQPEWYSSYDSSRAFNSALFARSLSSSMSSFRSAATPVSSTTGHSSGFSGGFSGGGGGGGGGGSW